MMSQTLFIALLVLVVAIFATDSYFGESWSMTITPLKR